MDKFFQLCEAKTWSKVHIQELGVLDTSDQDKQFLGKEVVVLGEEEAADTFFLNPKNGKPIRTTLVFTDGEVWRLGGDCLVFETFQAKPAGNPKEIAKLAKDGNLIRKPNEGVIQFQDDMPSFIWEQKGLYSAVVGTVDAEFAIEDILYAISVAPEEVFPTLYAALAQRYFETLDYYEETNQDPPLWDGAGFRLN